MEFGDGGRGEGGHAGFSHGFGHHGGVSFENVFLGVELGSALTHHSMSLADAEAAALFIDAALSHGGGYEFSFPTGSANDVPALQDAGMPDGPTAFTDGGRVVYLP